MAIHRTKFGPKSGWIRPIYIKIRVLLIRTKLDAKRTALTGIEPNLPPASLNN